jgi:predicted phosphodiesterase
MNKYLLRSAAVALVCAAATVHAALEAAPAESEGKPARAKTHPKQPSQSSSCNNVPVHSFDLILARPTRDSVTLSVLAYRELEACVAYGAERGPLAHRTPARRFAVGEPVQIVIGSLRPDTRYAYQFRAAGLEPAEGFFHTQRSPGSEFTFTVTADSHLDDRVDARLYQQTLANARNDEPDFHVDLGDTFMTDKHDSRASAERQYLAQRYYFDALCRAAPLFLVLGNHDGESPRGRGGEAESLAVWSNRMRKRYFPNPEPDGFYAGNATAHPEAGPLQDYYAWRWGDALFVTLDPYWFAQRQRGRGDLWRRTLGERQYRWLAQTLQSSAARSKFVFIHQLVGGADEQGRGGIEAAPFYEWGGKNSDGSDGFRQNRPGWLAPIHELLVRSGTSVVFHGHDHFYAMQQLGGIVYQEVPQPGTPGPKKPRQAEEYGYRSGVVQGGAGHLRVRVSPGEVRVDYVRADRSVAHAYSIPVPRGAATDRPN